jgi:hypothetical protein
MANQPIYQRVIDTQQGSVSGIVFEYRGTSKKAESEGRKDNFETGKDD